ncbi:AAA family ATPase [Segetibacter koreensis]|uniref:AAA family ATPase n=1 Tax=Segetibacter koreensis TaxID=398037 RepID=UPI00037CFAC0|nr:AAA family ATPase [Segetibacter koreensis]
MEAIIFCGIQASGKTTFYKENFFKTHVRISLDLLNTRRKEAIFLETCLQTQQRFVIDNTNITKKERLVYINKAKQYKFTIKGFYFETTVGEAITRNKNRTGKEIVPPAGIGGTYKKLQIPSYEEGYDELFKVKIVNGSFIVEKMGSEANIPGVIKVD